jgi:hypothetical protein
MTADIEYITITYTAGVNRDTKLVDKDHQISNYLCRCYMCALAKVACSLDIIFSVIYLQKLSFNSSVSCSLK